MNSTLMSAGFAAAVEEPFTGGVPAARDDQTQVNILVVDDREDKRLAMEAIIAELRQNVVMVSSGREALRCLLDQDFAVILLDVNMPGMDGFETAFLLRQRRNSEHTPIIFITATNDTETHVSRGYSLGAVDYILAPIVPEVLRTKVSVFVELHKKTAQLRQQADRLRHAHDELEVRVRRRTAELAQANRALQAEIGERQRAEEHIRKINLELEQRVLDRTAELAAANQELESFTYSVAHDLRAPLRHINGYRQMVEEKFAAELPPEAREFLQRIGRSSEHMGRLVDDLLNLARIGKQELSRQTVDLNALIEELVPSLTQEAGDREVEWAVARLPATACDPGLMKQVFFNLLSNAVKYTRPRRHTRIEVGQMETRGETVVFVRDNGVGFNMKYIDKLFGVFQRLHRPEDFEGTGVGLATVARIIRKHGGRIWAEGELNQGATFYFTLDGFLAAGTPA